jgi:uncharacterized DUF497 family protein
MTEKNYIWDSQKCESNQLKHGIDFLDAIEIFEVNHLALPTPQKGEQRWKAIGKTMCGFITVVYTMRGDDIRIISARKARDNERREFSKLYG